MIPLTYNAKGEVIPSLRPIPSSTLSQILIVCQPTVKYYVQLHELFATTFGVTRAAFGLYGASKDKFDVCLLWCCCRVSVVMCCDVL